ncbi:hypothetical protein HKX48_009205 [Thoreauomyces humboldtii]|nr:hypothetical protein HKX48_009205 [Thoreauomyces humboldtii]
MALGRSKKKAKVKKSINAMVLASGILATPGVPSFFATVKMHLRPRNGKDESTVATTPSLPVASGSRRAQSMSVLPTRVPPALVAARESGVVLTTSAPMVDPPAIKKPEPSAVAITDKEQCSAQPLSHRPAAAWQKAIAKPAESTTHDDGNDSDDMDFDAEFGFTDMPMRPPLTFDTPVLHNKGTDAAPPRAPKSKPNFPASPNGPTTIYTPKPPSEAPPDRNISPRRIQSAPTGLLKTYDDCLLLDDDGDEDADMWFVPSVRAKAERRLGTSGLVGAAADLEELEEVADVNLESWDDDFDAQGDAPLAIPEAVSQRQNHVKGDVVNLKKFALHIEDLKHLHSDGLDMAAGVPVRSRQRLEAVRDNYAQDLKRAEVLIALGDYAEDRPDSTAPTAQHLHVLVELMIGSEAGKSGQKSKQAAGNGGTVLSPAATEDLEQMVREGTLVFGVELIPVLMKHMGPLKLSLMKYLDDVRAVLLAQS